ncbi:MULTISPECIES: HPr kinase/phosphorylase [Brevundimonas]|uniref:HPr kinase/phosphorylase n=1 Tax=Brevundimonas sp. 357 TaxID=2555782 RepID=UPI000F78DE72|nr:MULTISPECIES: serine kinase [Brevundimonas]RSB42789.1 serine kinase [Brevundimonas sp. 357]
MTAPRQPLHATVAALRLGGAWRGVLIQGRSGAGKSDLTLRLMQHGWRLVGDDWVDVFACEGALYAAAPATIAGRMEVRGLGLVDRPFLPFARIALSLHLTHEPVERMPEKAQEMIDGIAIPRLVLDPRPASAPLVVAAAMNVVATLP